MTSYALEPLAYLKIVLHAAKRPTGTAVGLLVGKVDGSTARIVDAVPLLHHWTELSMAMEAGLQLAELHCRQQQWVFLGLYVANERLGDTGVPRGVAQAASAIRKERPEALVLVVDNEKLDGSGPAVTPHFPSSSTAWTPSTLSDARLTLSDPAIPTTALEHVKAGRHAALGDFDEHLEDPTVDWLRNAKVVL
ncbi:hypothetical protein JCM10207_002301 [Rhodosporidiobolus poonsookiae]